MDFGLMVFPTEDVPSPTELGRMAEDLGFESLWFPEHSHIPSSRQTPWGGVKGAAPLPEWYWKSLDAFVSLGAVSAVTSTLKLGTGITLVAQRDPIWTAKEVASLDVLSGGRVLFGIGYGWNKEELSHHGVAYTDRRQVLRERVLAMKELWTKEEASFNGEKVSFEPSWAWPKPVQQPHPPIIMGGEAGPKTIADMVEFCDGWMPLATRHDLAGKLDELNEALRSAGRDPKQFDLTAYGTKADPDVITHLIDLGVNRAVFNLPQRSREDVRSRVDSIVEIVSSLK